MNDAQGLENIMTSIGVVGPPLLQAEGPVNALDEEQDDRLPADQPAHPVQQLTVHHVRLLPRGREHSLECRRNQQLSL
jgi:hypothetical protein